jgi:hypothetical protein
MGVNKSVPSNPHWSAGGLARFEVVAQRGRCASSFFRNKATKQFSPIFQFEDTPLLAIGRSREQARPHTTRWVFRKSVKFAGPPMTRPVEAAGCALKKLLAEYWRFVDQNLNR